MNEFAVAVESTWNSLPQLARAAIAVAVGWLVAVAVRFAVSGLLKLLRVDKLSERIGMAEFLRKGGIHHSASALAGRIFYWFVVVATLVVASSILDIAVVSSLWEQAIREVPGILAGIIFLVVGLMLVSFFSNFALTIARNAALPNGRLVARGIKYAGILIVALVAMDQFGFKGNLLTDMLLIAFAAVSLALALAFGLGCKDLAKGAMERFIRTMREKDRDSQPTDLEG